MTLAPPNQDQANALNYLLHTNEHVFITGRAGTGKTHVLHHFQERTHKKIALAAPTGVAADNIGGSTLHRLVGVSTGLPADTGVDLNKVRSSRRWLQDIDVVVIDEVSMVNADMMDSVDRMLRSIRQNYYEPFGGVQMVMFGDLYQLPPVVTADDVPYYLRAGYKSPWFFDADIWQEIGLPRTFALQEVVRQKAGEFVDLLNGVRDGTIDWQGVDRLNEIGSNEPSKFSKSMLLSNRRVEAAERNRERLAALKGKRHTYEARISAGFGWETPTEKVLDLKAGAQVMMLNNDRQDRWFNGTTGIVRSLDPDMVVVSIDGQDHVVERHAWVPNGTPPDAYKTAPKFVQMPMKLAWGSTIHKSQGLTLDEIEVDLGPYGVRTAGQTYVALSRVRTPEGLHIKTPIKMSDIIVDSDVARFFQQVQEQQG